MFNLYPYTDFHELNLDMILRMIKELHKEWSDFEAVNKITNAGAWDITKQYQAWTIVSDNNVGYISLKPVPAGVAITNTDYWGLVADYDILITDLSNRISTLEGQMSTLNNTTIPAINAEFDLIENRNFLVCGDSYMAQDNTPGQYDYVSWKAPHFMQKALNIPDSRFHLFAVSGTAFFNETLNAQLSDPAALALANDITDIVVVGGLNDSAQVASDVESGMNNFITYAREHYPNAKRIYLGFAGSARDDSAALAGRNVDERMGARFMYEVRGAELGFIIIPNLVESWSFGKAWYYSDGVHPTFNAIGSDGETGAKLLGSAIASFIQTGGVHTKYTINNTTLGSASIKYTYDNEYAYFLASGISDSFITVNAGGVSMSYVSFELFTTYINRRYVDFMPITIVSNGQARTITARFIWQGSYLSIEAADYSGGSAVVYPNVTTMYLPPVLKVPRQFAI